MTEIIADNLVKEGRSFGHDVINGIMYPREKICFGEDGSIVDVSATDPLPVTQASTAHSVKVDVICPANVTQYAVNDAIGDTGGSAIIAFAGVGKAGKPVIITGIDIIYGSATLPTGNSNLTANIFNSSPTAVADNAAFDIPSGDRVRAPKEIALGILHKKYSSTCVLYAEGLTTQIPMITNTLYLVLTTDAVITRAENSTPISITLHTIEV